MMLKTARTSSAFQKKTWGSAAPPDVGRSEKISRLCFARVDRRETDVERTFKLALAVTYESERGVVCDLDW